MCFLLLSALFRENIRAQIYMHSLSLFRAKKDGPIVDRRIKKERRERKSRRKRNKERTTCRRPRHGSSSGGSSSDSSSKDLVRKRAAAITFAQRLSLSLSLSSFLLSLSLLSRVKCRKKTDGVRRLRQERTSNLRRTPKHTQVSDPPPKEKERARIGECARALTNSLFPKREQLHTLWKERKKKARVCACVRSSGRPLSLSEKEKPDPGGPILSLLADCTSFLGHLEVFPMLTLGRRRLWSPTEKPPPLLLSPFFAPEKRETECVTSFSPSRRPRSAPRHSSVAWSTART